MKQLQNEVRAIRDASACPEVVYFYGLTFNEVSYFLGGGIYYMKTIRNRLVKNMYLCLDMFLKSKIRKFITLKM